MAEPLVSIGIPTFNRVERLRRAAESVLAQTHRNLELVISDNASDDGTDALGRELAARDPRVRYLCATENRGLSANFNTLYREMRGDYVMTLSDDDWLSDGYVAACLRALRARPDHVLVCGLARYVAAGEVVRTGVPMQIQQDDLAERVCAYLATVDENGVLYGVMARDVLARAAPMRNVLANDWLVVAGILAQGKALTLDEVAVFRDVGGTSGSFPKLVRTLGLPPWQARIPQLVIAREVFAEIAWRGPVFRGTPARIRLAAHAAWSVIDWASLAWHLTLPTFEGLSRRPRARWLWRAFQHVTKALGASWTYPGAP